MTLASLESWWEFAAGIAAVLLYPLLVEVARKPLNLLHRRLFGSSAFDVSGFWVGECWLPGYGENRRVEIWRYVLKGDRITLSFYSYDRLDAKAVGIWRGSGTFRASKLSAFYFEANADTYDSGTIALEVRGRRLIGAYTQFYVSEDREPLFTSPLDYAQTRVKLDFWPRMRAYFRLAPYKDFTEIPDPVLKSVRALNLLSTD
jgi:hypothetical protein